MAPTLSVVIPTRNRLQLLRQAVASAVGSDADREVIIVDDASDDGTHEWLSGLNRARVRHLRMDTHVERSAARNRGFEIAEGEFVLFLDDDDRLVSSGADTLVRELRKSAETVAGLGGQVAFNEAGHRRREPHPVVPMKRVVWPEVLLGWNRPPGQWIIRTDMLRVVGGWDETLIAGEDGELWLRLGARGPVLVHPAVVLEKRAHTAQWLPSDLPDIVTRYFEAFVPTLPPREHARARKAIRGGQEKYTGMLLFKQGRCREALPHLARAVKTCPRLITSPLTGPQTAAMVLKTIAGALLGVRGTSAFRRFSAFVRRHARRATGAGDTIARVEGSARRPD